MVIRCDTMGFWECSGCDTDVIYIRDRGDNGISMDIKSGFCQLLDVRKVARGQIIVATRVDTEDENFSPFHVLCMLRFLVVYCSVTLPV